MLFFYCLDVLLKINKSVEIAVVVVNNFNLKGSLVESVDVRP